MANTAKRGCFILLYYVPAQKRERKHWPEADCLHEHDHLRHGKLATRRPTRRGDSDRFISPTLLLLACYNRISSRGRPSGGRDDDATMCSHPTNGAEKTTGCDSCRRNEQTSDGFYFHVRVSDGLFIPSDNIRRTCLMGNSSIENYTHFLYVTGPTYHTYKKKSL